MPPGGLGGLVPCWAWLACLLPACCLVCLLGPGCLHSAAHNVEKNYVKNNYVHPSVWADSTNVAISF